MFSVGDRVSLDDGSVGTLRFLGPTQFRQGVWAGIELDEPTGKHSGTVEGVVYFKTAPNRAVFVHPSKLARIGARTRKSSAPVTDEWSSRTTLQAENIKGPAEDTKGLGENVKNLAENRTPIQHATKMGPISTVNQAITHAQTPPTLSRFDMETLRQTNNTTASTVEDTDRYSLANMEAELKKRQLDLQNAKSELNALRLQISDQQDLSDYLLNRERLLNAVDNYEKLAGRYERQTKRVNYLQLKGEREKKPMEAESGALKILEEDKEALLAERLDLARKLEEAKSKLGTVEESFRTMQEQLRLKEEAEEHLKQQLRDNASTVAGLNRDRSVLRKEVSDLRTKLTEIVSDEGEDTNVNSEELAKLSEELLATKEKHAALVEENRKLTEERNNILCQEADDLEKLNIETVAACKKYEERLRKKDEEILELTKKKDEISELLNEVELLKKEKELGNTQVSALQSKLIDYQDAAQMESKYRVQNENLRESLEESHKKYTAELAEKDARIDEMQRHISTMSRPPSDKDANISTILSSASGTDAQASLERIATQLVEEQHRFAELYKAKQTQEKYLMQQISKYKRRYANQAKFVGESGVSVSSERQEDDSDAKILELQGEIEQIKKEREESEKKKDTELYSLQLRLYSVETERDKIKAKADELAGPLSKSQSEIENLNKEISNLVEERNALRLTHSGDSDQARKLTVELAKANERLKVVSDLLNKRTDDLARLETTMREHAKTIQTQNVTIENLKREYAGRTEVDDVAQKEMQNKVDQLQRELQITIRNSQSLERVVQERDEFAQAFEQAKLECERLHKIKESRESSEGLLVLDSSSGDRAQKLEQDLATARQALEDKESLITRLTKQKESLEKAQTAFNSAGSLSEHDISKLDSLYDQLRTLRVQNEHLERALADARDKCRELEQQPSLDISSVGDNVDAQVIALRRNLEGEMKKRKELEAHNNHKKEMLDLAEKELTDLQQKISELEITDEQRQRLAVKFSALKEDLRLAEERLIVKEQEIQQLEARLDQVSKEGPIGGIVTESDVIKRLKDEKDQAISEKTHLQRMNSSLEHEKVLLEAELTNIRDALKVLKTEVGIKQQHALLAKAGHLIDELHQTHQESSWKILNPIKSVASFMRIYKPADVDVAKLQREYEELLASLDSHGAGKPPVLKIEDKICGVCRRPGHTAVQCDNLSETHDPFPLLTIDSGDPRAFSA